MRWTGGVVARIARAADASLGYGELIGRSQVMQNVFAMVDTVAAKDVSMLITGENGTGKQLLGRELQRQSPREDQEFVTFSCASLPEQLLESGLLGHEKRAFTGTDWRKRGLFEVADGGMVLLDEIGEMSLMLQAGLLRFLQSGEYKPLGSDTTADIRCPYYPVDSPWPWRNDQKGKFREGLFYRPNVIEICLPSRRDRGDDVLLIADCFLKHDAKRFKVAAYTFREEVRNLLRSDTFPGNVRE